MRALSHSSSDPGLGKLRHSSAIVGASTGGSGEEAPRRVILEGPLLVARSPPASGVEAEWEPFHFTHHHDGSVSFQALREEDGVEGTSWSTSAASGGRVVGTNRHAEFFLDADWRQPFLAAPWKPLPNGWSPRQAADQSHDQGGQELFPFTLSYAPLRGRPGRLEAQAIAAERRTIVLAAADAKTRQQWLSTFSQKAQAYELRPKNAMGPVGPKPPQPGAGRGLPGKRRCFGVLGDIHGGLPMLPSTGASKVRLPGGRTRIWETTSSLSIVRDLYDGYAADPLGSKPPLAKVPSGLLPPTSGAVWSDKRAKFLEKYVEKQAEIEQLLEQRLITKEEERTAQPAPAMPQAITTLPDLMESTIDEVVEESVVAKPAYALAARTPNAFLEGDMLRVANWSGGVLFAPPDEHAFSLTVRPLDPFETCPIFLGIAPADSDLTMVNFFTASGGIFLGVGGCASESLIAALGAPGGPCFHIYGQRSQAELPVVPAGATLTVHYAEEEDAKGRAHGVVSFIVGDESGHGLYYARPKLPRRLPAGGWVPCVLLCVPETRMHILRLASAPLCAQA
mmetsp:Transcript_10976/g.23069  ORF Transcript_10976/g.23069 Transcript_10976/m.23069 type:complete len:565 (-) Transcript_10976:58-1752(-)